jgi:hypothetical protein
MIVSDQNDVENIVNKNPDLSWDGWDVVHLVQDDYAEYLLIGVFDNSTRQWYKKTTYPCTDKGWDLPESVM